VHYLHHAKFTVNFGTPVVPLDRLLGTHLDKQGPVDLIGTRQWIAIFKENYFWMSLAVVTVGLLAV